MMKTKAQMRKEVVERLKGINSYSTVGDILCALCGKADYRTWDPTKDSDALIELLTDDCDEPCYTCSKLSELLAENSALREIVGDLKVPTDPGDASMMSVNAFIKKQTEHESLDSREKLEADVSAWIANEMGILAKYGIEDVVLQQAVFEWLNRQAALTERKWTEYLADATRQIDGLEKERDEFSHKLKHEMELNRQCRNAHDLERIAELTAERDKLSTLELNQRVKANEWRDKYYEAKKRLDDIRETVRNATLVDLDGEVVEE